MLSTVKPGIDGPLAWPDQRRSHAKHRQCDWDDRIGRSRTVRRRTFDSAAARRSLYAAGLTIAGDASGLDGNVSILALDLLVVQIMQAGGSNGPMAAASWRFKAE